MELSRQRLLNVKLIKGVLLIIASGSFPVYIFQMSLLKDSVMDIGDIWVYIVAIVGVLVLIAELGTYKLICGKWLDLYSIFLMFFTLFNFGQCICWAFGIHASNEIGTYSLYRHLDPSNNDIIAAQMVFIECSLLLHCAVISKKNGFCSISDKKSRKVIELQENRALFNASLLISLIAVPVSFVYWIILLRASRSVGYQALYYGGVMTNVNGLIIIINKLFFSCLVGILVGSAYKDCVVKVVYGIFGVYAVLSLMSGDRGAWIYSLIILMWMHHTFYKRIKAGKMILLLAVGFFALQVVNAITSVRNTGISIENILNAMTNSDNNPIIHSIMEMGASMGVNIVMIREQPIYPYGNSYIMAALGCITTKIPSLLGLDYVTPTSWFSQQFLGLSWGAGFTIIAEPMLNFGIYLTPIVFWIYGKIFSRYFDIENIKSNSIRIFTNITMCEMLLNFTRSTMHELLKNIIFGLLPILILTFIFTQRYDDKRKIVIQSKA